MKGITFFAFVSCRNQFSLIESQLYLDAIYMLDAGRPLLGQPKCVFSRNFVSARERFFLSFVFSKFVAKKRAGWIEMTTSVCVQFGFRIATAPIF